MKKPARKPRPTIRATSTGVPPLSAAPFLAAMIAGALAKREQTQLIPDIDGRT